MKKIKNENLEIQMEGKKRISKPRTNRATRMIHAICPRLNDLFAVHDLSTTIQPEDAFSVFFSSSDLPLSV